VLVVADQAPVEHQDAVRLLDDPSLGRGDEPFAGGVTLDDLADGGLPWKYDAAGNVAKISPQKPVMVFETSGGEEPFVLEEAIVADFGLVRAWRGDRHGNLVFKDSARNFNPLAAMAGKVTIAEVEELVELGEIDPNDVHLPGVYVHRVVPLTPSQSKDKRIEKRTVRTRGRN
jgi:3-oxoacid CoA-transferase subunit A